MADVDVCGDCIWCDSHLAEFPHKDGCPVPRAKRAEAALAVAVEALKMYSLSARNGRRAHAALTRINELRGTPSGGTGR